MPKGVTPRHARSCSKSKGGERCTCTPSFQAQVWDPAAQRRTSRTFTGPDAEQDAIDWRSDRQREIREGTFRPDRQITVRVGLDELIAGMRTGTVRNRKGKRYKPSVIRDYARDAENHIKPAFGSANPRDLRGADVQRLVDRLVAEDLKPSTIRNILMPLRVLYRRLLRLEEVTVSPMDHLELPADEGKRLRIASPEEAAELIAALPVSDQPVWATATYGGLRVGEIQALGEEHVDLATGLIVVEWTWDRVERKRVRPKSEAGERSVPVPAILRGFLLDHRMDRGDAARDFFFDAAGFQIRRTLLSREGEPFRLETLQERADRAWAAAGLQRLTFHDCRHTFASYMIQAMSESKKGFNPKLLSKIMGHASIAITIDRYGHLFPGDEESAADALDAYLERANTAARRAMVTDG